MNGKWSKRDLVCWMWVRFCLSFFMLLSIMEDYWYLFRFQLQRSFVVPFLVGCWCYNHCCCHFNYPSFLCFLRMALFAFLTGNFWLWNPFSIGYISISIKMMPFSEVFQPILVLHHLDPYDCFVWDFWIELTEEIETLKSILWLRIR